MDAVLDGFVSSLYTSADCLLWIWHIIRAVCLYQYPYVRELCIFTNAINGSLGAYAGLSDKPVYWLHSLVATALNSFGGGYIAFMLIGRPSAPLNNDIIIFSTVLAWFLIFNLKLSWFFSHTYVRTIWSCALGMFRTHAVVGIVTMANTILAPTAYYPIPLFGPIIAGTVLGCMGSFLPFTKGYSAIQECAPWTLQAAYYAAYFYHTMVQDGGEGFEGKGGWVGATMRALLGTYTREQVLLIIVFTQILHLQAHIYLSPHFNIFAPLHQLCYLVFPVTPGLNKAADMVWSDAAKQRLWNLLAVLRWLVGVLVILGYVLYTVPPTYLPTYPVSSTPPATLYELGWAYTHTAGVQWQHQKGSIAKGSSYNATLSRFQYQDLLTRSYPLGTVLGQCQILHRPLPAPLPALRSCAPLAAQLSHLTLAAPPAPASKKWGVAGNVNGNGHNGNVTAYVVQTYDQLTMKGGWGLGSGGEGPRGVWGLLNTTETVFVPAAPPAAGHTMAHPVSPFAPPSPPVRPPRVTFLSDGGVIVWVDETGVVPASGERKIVYTYGDGAGIKRLGGEKGFYGLGLVRGELAWLGGGRARGAGKGGEL